jgi:2-methylcitrate dehydratase PrpD
MQMGFCVRNGIYAALMAQSGIGAPQAFLTGRHGLFPAYFGECDEDAALAGLGDVFMGTRLGFKGHPCCAAMHQAMDAVREVRDREQVTPEQVDRIVVHGAPSMAITCQPIEAKQQPRNHVEQSFSLPWATACMLTADQLSLGDFREEALQDPIRQALARRVFAELDAPDDGVHVVVTLKDGRDVRSGVVDAPTGHPDRPYSMDGLIDRYRDFVQQGPDHLRDEPGEQALEMVLAMEEQADATAAIRLLA